MPLYIVLSLWNHFQIIIIIRTFNNYFSIILLKVVQNLRISTLELRGEDSPDVTPYTHDKQIEPIFLNLSKQVTDFLEQFLVVSN